MEKYWDVKTEKCQSVRCHLDLRDRTSKKKKVGNN